MKCVLYITGELEKKKDRVYVLPRMAQTSRHGNKHNRVNKTGEISIVSTLNVLFILIIVVVNDLFLFPREWATSIQLPVYLSVYVEQSYEYKLS